MTNSTQNQAQFINFHAEGIAYVNRFRENTTRNGDVFCSVTLGFLHGQIGDGKKPQVTYVDCIIRNKDVCDLMKQHQAAINNGDQKVTAVARISDMFADEPFELKGKMVSAIKGRLIGLKQMKVDGNVVYSNTNSDQEDGVNEQPQPGAQPAQVEQPQSNHAQPAQFNQPQPVQNQQSKVIKLDKNDPDFKSKKEALKAQGYRWNREMTAWVATV